MCTSWNTKRMDSFFLLEANFIIIFTCIPPTIFLKKNFFIICISYNLPTRPRLLLTWYITLSDSGSKLFIWFYILLYMQTITIKQNDLTIIFHKFHFLSCFHSFCMPFFLDGARTLHPLESTSPYFISLNCQYKPLKISCICPLSASHLYSHFLILYIGICSL